MLDPIHLTAFVASRICHDLISPIGAIGNGVELMIMDASGSTGQETALILESAVNANARIRYFRVAFGQCGQDQRIARSEVLSILTDSGAGGRITTQWESPPDLARRDVKLTFLALMCLESALIHGGEIHICLSDQGWVLTATAPRIRAGGPLWQALSAPSDDCFDDIDAGQIHFAIFQMEAARQHRRIQISGGESLGTLTLRF
jgi:histidine phosphotransferase ChpT